VLPRAPLSPGDVPGLLSRLGPFGPCTTADWLTVPSRGAQSEASPVLNIRDNTHGPPVER